MGSTVDAFRDALFQRFEAQGSDRLNDLVAAIDQEARDARSPVGTMLMVAKTLGDWYDRSGQREFLDTAIEISQEFVVAPQSNFLSDYSAACERLAIDLIKRYQLDGCYDQLELVKQIAEHCSSYSPSNSSFSFLLAIALLLTYERLGESAESDLDRSIAIFEMLCEQQNLSEFAEPKYKCNLLSALLWRHETSLWRLEFSKSLDHLNKDVELAEAILKQTPSDDDNRPSRVNRLCSALLLRYELAGKKPDLDRVIELLDKLKDLPTLRHGTKLIILNTLSTALRRLYELTACDEYLDRALSIASSLIADIHETDLNRNIFLNTHLSCLRLSVSLPSYTDSLTSAIAAFETTLETSENLGPYSADFRTTIANALIDLYDRTGLADTLVRATDFLRAALEPSAPGDNPIILHSLAVVLNKRFEECRGGRMENLLEEALVSAKRAVELLEKQNRGEQLRATFLNTLSVAHCIRGLDNDAEEAEKHSMSALSLTPESHPNWPVFQFNLARALSRLAEINDDPTRRNDAILAYVKAFTSNSAIPELRIKSAIEGVNLISTAEPKLAYDILRRAVEQLPLASSRGLKRIDQQYTLSKFFGLASAAASLALNAGEPAEEAIRILELGRGIMANFYLDGKSELDALQAQHSDLADSFQSLRRELDISDFESQQFARDSVSQAVGITASLRRKELSQQLEDLIALIQTKNGFETFLRGPSIGELKHAAWKGPVVFLNAAALRCDALIINSKENGSQILPLPTELQDVEKQMMEMKLLLKSLDTETYLEAETKLRNILVWLWDKVVGPIMDFLGFRSSQESESLPKVWWIPCGPFAFLPLHAAGSHKKKSVQNTLDCVVSCYAPTLRTLVYARRQMSISVPASETVNTFIAMSQTPDRVGLPNIEEEIKIVSQRIPIKILRKPTKKQVLDALEYSQIGIFGCHGEADDSNPSKSRLLLQDWQRDALTVSDLVSLRSKRSQLAILSACHSANNPNLELLDETIHLTSALQIAGFPRVIGNLWQARDLESTELMENIFTGLSEGEYGKIDLEKVAEALHKGLRILRDKTRIVKGTKMQFPHKPLIWAPYICMSG